MTVTVNVSTPEALADWILEGPAGPVLQALVSEACAFGLAVERAGPAYRVRGDRGTKAALAALAVEFGDAYGCAPEAPPVNGVNVTATTRAKAPTARTTVVHGTQAHALIAGAIDHGLTVERIGAYRFAVNGPTVVQMRWWAAVQGVTVDEAAAVFGLKPADIAREDAPIAVRVELPARRSESDITRNLTGDITKVVMVERTTTTTAEA
ncbi:hypothetical protein [Ideonella sp. A 288]|uniref:hypothetical protein n=1 Tax=Ideonella sp. A 288 TaxID=1962181 RepID=UPI000B4B7989|nr:hypothetical protein [Ideonella sp. A 288]